MCGFAAANRVINRASKTPGDGRTASYHVLGVLTAHDQLLLPGGTFSRSDHARLQAYFAGCRPMERMPSRRRGCVSD